MPNKVWSFDLSKHKAKPMQDPLGFKTSTNEISIRFQTKQGMTAKELEVLTAKSWTVVTSIFQTMFMTLFMFWMTGSGISIWTIMITVSFLISPIRQLFSVNQAFAVFEGKIPLFLQKVAYVGLHLVLLACAFYKFSAMGIVPDKAVDWMYLLDPPKYNSVSFGLF